MAREVALCRGVVCVKRHQRRLMKHSEHQQVASSTTETSSNIQAYSHHHALPWLEPRLLYRSGAGTWPWKPQVDLHRWHSPDLFYRDCPYRCRDSDEERARLPLNLKSDIG